MSKYRLVTDEDGFYYTERRGVLGTWWYVNGSMSSTLGEGRAVFERLIKTGSPFKQVIKRVLEQS